MQDSGLHIVCLIYLPHCLLLFSLCGGVRIAPKCSVVIMSRINTVNQIPYHFEATFNNEEVYLGRKLLHFAIMFIECLEFQLYNVCCGLERCFKSLQDLNY